jgi:hypothetical protein
MGGWILLLLFIARSRNGALSQSKVDRAAVDTTRQTVAALFAQSF